MLDQGEQLEAIVVRLNNYIASRHHELVSVTDPETPPYNGE